MRKELREDQMLLSWCIQSTSDKIVRSSETAHCKIKESEAKNCSKGTDIEQEWEEGVSWDFPSTENSL